VLADTAPDRWTQSALLAPFGERLFEERAPLDRNLEESRRLGRQREGNTSIS
jgi:hypothetical protein